MKVAVIGGGPSGMMAAYFAAKNKNQVSLYEKNEKLGKKLFITGKGRCNITNAKDISEFFDQVSRNSKFLYSAFYSFTNLDMIDLLNNNGVPTQVERGDRVFPKSNKSSDVIKVYEKLLSKENVNILLNTEVKSLVKKDEKFYINKDQVYDKVIVATGGISYQGTGSTGDGYKFAKSFSIKTTDLKAGLIPIELNDDFIKDLQGLALKNVELIAEFDKKKKHTEFGELLFTHFGISGPTVLTMSNLINRANNIKLYLDLKPALDFQKLDNRLVRDFDNYKNKIISNALDDLLPKKLIDPILKLAGFSGKEVVNEITKEKRHDLVRVIKKMPLSYKKLFDINAAIITSGGIDIKEIDSSTMESKKVEGLYFCGEVLDLDAFTGGYNLQIANSTGFLAGNSITD